MSGPIRSRGRTIAALVSTTILALALAVVPGNAQADPEGAATSTTLNISGGFSYGDPMTLTATVTSEAGTPSGSVDFSVEGTLLADDVPVDGSGVAEVTIPAPTTGLAGYTAAFHGSTGWADSSGFSLWVTSRAGVVLKPEPTILEISHANPLKITLTMSARATSFSTGKPIPGEELTFSVFGKQPNLFDFGGGTIICKAVTDATGFASCKGSGVIGAVLSLLAGGSYVTHFQTPHYGFSSAKAKVIVLGP